MQNDVSDAVQWAIDEGIADPERVCIYGGSYGGYATMAGLTFTPDRYKCGINYVGVTDLPSSSFGVRCLRRTGAVSAAEERPMAAASAAKPTRWRWIITSKPRIYWLATTPTRWGFSRPK